MASVDFDVHALYDALDAQRRSRGLSWLDRAPESFVPGHPTMTSLPDVRRDQILRFDTSLIYATLDARRIDREMTWKKVASEIQGFTPASLTRLARGGRTAFPHVARIAQWLGVPVAHFTRAFDR